MRELIIQENDAEQRLDKFLQKKFPTLPKSLMYKYIRNKNIKVNKKKCDISYKLKIDDILTFYISDEFFDVDLDYDFLKASNDLEVIYEDNNLLIVDKPVGLIVHSDINESIDTLINRVKLYLYNNSKYDPKLEHSFVPSLVHRIDRNTSGLVIIAKNASTLRELNSYIRDNLIDKYYLCLVEGCLNKREDTLVSYHKKIEGNKVKIVNKDSEGYKKVVLAYKVLSCKNNQSLLEIKLITGKSHQIRAQMANINHPLIGDYKYGSRNRQQEYQALCAYKIVFNLPKNDALSYLNYLKIKIDKINFNIKD